MSNLTNEVESNLPGYKKTAFVCPFCGVYAHQSWDIHLQNSNRGSSSNYSKYELLTSRCHKCHEDCVWYNKKMIYPVNTGLPRAHSDMPAEVRTLYEESAQIYNISRRASLALLRIAIEMLVNELSGNSGGRLFDKIGTLKSKNIINDMIQEAFDSFRVIGNQVVHPGQIELDDNIDHAILFSILNFMVDIGIAKPLQIRKLFEDSVPDPQKEAINKRDLKNSTSMKVNPPEDDLPQK